MQSCNVVALHLMLKYLDVIYVLQTSLRIKQQHTPASHLIEERTCEEAKNTK